jgi:hypothetical protein
METPLLAGVARTEITPPIGIMLAGTLRDAASTAIERELTATSLVMSRGESKVALIAVDLIRLRVEDAAELRARVGQAIGIPASNVLLNTSHAHATPDPPGWQEYDESAQEEMARHYWRDVWKRIVEVAQAADEQRRPARLGVGEGAARIGVNRREQLADGTMVLGENSGGAIDPTVGVVRVDGEDRSPIALLLAYACHPDILGPKCELVSPDYVGAARATAEAVTGATTLFFQGASGDVDPRCGIVLGDDGVDEVNRLGGELGCEAARVFHTINTHRRRERRVAWRSVTSVVTAWSYEDSPTALHGFVGASSRTLQLPLRPYPAEATALEELARARSLLSEVQSRPHSLADRLVARKRVQWSELQLAAIKSGHSPSLDVELQAVRIDDLVLLSIPGEPFVEIGLSIKERSRAPHTFVLGNTNGTYFYIPTANAFAQGGYEIDSHCNYQQPSGPTPEWEGILITTATEMIDELMRSPVAMIVADVTERESSIADAARRGS